VDVFGWWLGWAPASRCCELTPLLQELGEPPQHGRAVAAVGVQQPGAAAESSSSSSSLSFAATLSVRRIVEALVAVRVEVVGVVVRVRVVVRTSACSVEGPAERRGVGWEGGSGTVVREKAITLPQVAHGNGALACTHGAAMAIAAQAWSCMTTAQISADCDSTHP
jgi:hypothetical protein